MPPYRDFPLVACDEHTSSQKAVPEDSEGRKSCATLPWSLNIRRAPTCGRGHRVAGYDIRILFLYTLLLTNSVIDGCGSAVEYHRTQMPLLNGCLRLTPGSPNPPKPGVCLLVFWVRRVHFCDIERNMTVALVLQCPAA